MLVDKTAELGVIGGMLNHKEALYETMSVVEPSYFTTQDVGDLYDRIIEESSKGNVSASVMLRRVKSSAQKEMIRTADSSYKGMDPFRVDLEKIKTCWVNRNLKSISEKVQQSIEFDQAPKQTIEYITDELGRLYFDDDGDNIIDPAQDADEGEREFIEQLENPESSYGLRFSVDIRGRTLGFPNLDKVFRGAQGGDLFLLAAKTGEGKTALATNISRIFSLYQNYRGYYENTEMKVKELRARLIAPLAGVKTNEVMDSDLEGDESERQDKIHRISRAFQMYRSSGLHLSRIPTLTANKSKALAKQVKNRYGSLDYLMIDYIGRLDLEHSSGMQEWQVMFKAIQMSKELAMELNIPVFVLSQRNHMGEIEGAKKIANECDGVLYFEPVTDDDENELAQQYLDEDRRKRANYKIVKRKIRRSSDVSPIYCEFDKDRQFINQVI